MFKNIIILSSIVSLFVAVICYVIGCPKFVAGTGWLIFAISELTEYVKIKKCENLEKMIIQEIEEQSRKIKVKELYPDK